MALTHQNEFSYDELISCARASFWPRQSAIAAPPMLMTDRITRITETGGAYDKGYIEAELDITPDLWFSLSFPGEIR